MKIQPPGMIEGINALRTAHFRDEIDDWTTTDRLAEIVLTAATPAIMAATFADAADLATEEGYPETALFLDTLSNQVRERTA